MYLKNLIPEELKLYVAQNELLFVDDFESELSAEGEIPNGWVASKEFQKDENFMDWHIMSIDTNEDQSTGLDGNIKIKSFGSYWGGSVEKEFTIDSFGELIFEYYLQNGDPDAPTNYLEFWLDGEIYFRAVRATSWKRIEPIVLFPGTHTIKFVYNCKGVQKSRKAAFDNVTVWSSRRLFCKIRDYKPPRPDLNFADSKILRGFKRKQEMREHDILIQFQAIFYAEHYIDFVSLFKRIFYFVDEYQRCFRGVFKKFEIENIALASAYSFDLELVCGRTIKADNEYVEPIPPLPPAKPAPPPEIGKPLLDHPVDFYIVTQWTNTEGIIDTFWLKKTGDKEGKILVTWNEESKPGSISGYPWSYGSDLDNGVYIDSDNAFFRDNQFCKREISSVVGSVDNDSTLYFVLNDYKDHSCPAGITRIQVYDEDNNLLDEINPVEKIPFVNYESRPLGTILGEDTGDFRALALYEFVFNTDTGKYDWKRVYN